MPEPFQLLTLSPERATYTHSLPLLPLHHSSMALSPAVAQRTDSCSLTRAGGQHLGLLSLSAPPGPSLPHLALFPLLPSPPPHNCLLINLIRKHRAAQYLLGCPPTGQAGSGPNSPGWAKQEAVGARLNLKIFYLNSK